MSRRTALALIAGAGVVFVLLGLHRLDRPGLHHGECDFAASVERETRPLIESLSLHALLFRGTAQTWFHFFLSPPGPLTPAQIRAPRVFVGLALIVLITWFAWRYLGRREAVLATWLLVLDPAVLNYLRQDFYRFEMLFLFRVLTLLLACWFIRRGHWWRWTMVLLCFALLGFTWSQPLAVLPFCGGAFVAWLWLRKQAVIGRRLLWLWSLFAGLLLLRPVFGPHVHWVRSWGEPVISSRRWDVLFDFLSGWYPAYSYLGSGNLAPKANLLPYALVVGAAVVWWRIRAVRQDPAWQDGARWFVVGACFTPLLAYGLGFETLWPHHLTVWHPSLHLSAAVLLFAAFDHGVRSARARWWAQRLLLIPLLVSCVFTALSTQVLLDRRGGRGEWSPSVYQLADEIRQRAPDRVFLTSRDRLHDALTAVLGPFSYDTFFWSCLTGSWHDFCLNPLLANNALFVTSLSTAEIGEPDEVAAMERFAVWLGYGFHDVRVIQDTTGEPLYVVFRIGEGGAPDLCELIQTQGASP